MTENWPIVAGNVKKKRRKLWQRHYFPEWLNNKGIDFGKSTVKLVEATSNLLEVGEPPQVNLNDTLIA